MRLPADQQLVAIRLAGSPALAQRSTDNDWRVVLGPPRLPSLLEVVTRSSRFAEAGGHHEIQRPALLAGSEPIPVEINLWSLGYPDTTSRPAIGIPAEATVAEQAVLRFDRLLSIAESATSTAMEAPPPDGYRWYRPWLALLTRLRDGAVTTLSNPDGRQAASQVSRPAEEQLNESSTRLVAWSEQCDKTLVAPRADSEIPELWSSDFAAGRELMKRWVYCVTDGGLDRLVVVNITDNVRPRTDRALGVLAVIGLSVASVLLMRRPAACDLLYQWPHALGFMIGMAWWAWMQPSWCGLLIALVCVALALRSGWPGRSIRLDASTVLRSSRPK
jgi:hypothetical protein